MANAELKRVLSRKDVLALAFGAMIGWGWVVLSGEWISQAGSLGAALAFFVGGTVICLIGLAYAELASAMPKVGGEHVYTHRAFGRTGSFICTWSIILGYVSVVAFEAVAFPTVLEYLIPNFNQGRLWTLAGWDVYLSWALSGMVAAALMMCLNILGVRPAALLQTVVTLLILAAGVFLVLGAAVDLPGTDLEPLFGKGLAGFFSVLIMVPFMFVGFDVIPQAAEEINLPYRDIGRTLVVSVVMAVLFYVLVILGVAVGTAGVGAGEAELSTARAATSVWGGQWAGTLLVLAGLAGILTSWNAFLIGGSRAVYAMAKAGMLPGFLARLSPRFRTPVNAILLIGSLSVLAPLFGRQALIWLVNAGGLGIVFGYALVAAAFLALRRQEPQMPRPFRAGTGPWVGYAALILAIAIALLYLPGSPSALTWPWEWAIIILWVMLGAVFLLTARGSDV